jgi:hypothetical protein
MEKKYLKEIIMELTLIVVKGLVSEGIWNNFGYKKMPTYRKIFAMIFKKNFQLPVYLYNTLSIIFLVDVANSIKFSSLEKNIKKNLLIGVLDEVFKLVTKVTDSNLVDEFRSTYKKIDFNSSKPPYSFLFDDLKIKLSKENSAKFIVGIINLYTTRHLLDDKSSHSHYLLLDVKKISKYLESIEYLNISEIESNFSTYNLYSNLADEILLE